MNWLIDSDVLIEGERGNPAFVGWLKANEENFFATADAIAAEFLVGAHALRAAKDRAVSELFWRDRISKLPRFPHPQEDWFFAARLAGEARRAKNPSQPSLADALLATVALRLGFTVATRNIKDFEAMGCPCLNPLTDPSREGAA